MSVVKEIIEEEEKEEEYNQVKLITNKNRNNNNNKTSFILKSFNFASNIASKFNFDYDNDYKQQQQQQQHLTTTTPTYSKTIKQAEPTTKNVNLNKRKFNETIEKQQESLDNDENQFLINKENELSNNKEKKCKYDDDDDKNKLIVNNDEIIIAKHVEKEEEDSSSNDIIKKKKSFNQNNYRRLNMKAKGFKKKFGNFKLTGAKLKRFVWYKRNGSKNVNYNLKDDDGEIQNENMCYEKEIDGNNDEAPGPVISLPPEEDSEEGLIFKTKKKYVKQRKVTKKKVVEEEKEKKSRSRSSSAKKVEERKSGDEEKLVDEEKEVKQKKPRGRSTAKMVAKSGDEEKLVDEEKEVKQKKPRGRSTTKKVAKSGDEEKKKVKKPRATKKKEVAAVAAIESDDDSIDLNEIEAIEETLKHSNADDGTRQLTVFNANPDGTLPTASSIDSKIDKMLQKNFNFKHYKPLQKEAILRILCGQSTIALFSTGYGKSLIYQICTKFYRDKYKETHKCLVLIISPLISLMNDQLVNLNKCINGASCDSQMDEAAYKNLMENLNQNKIDLLFLSPEALLLNKRLNAVLKEFKILFVCIDEVHCLSQWSHNFRPSYLQICKLLHNEYDVKCILGLTATATPQTIKEIKSYFHINDDNILRNTNLPKNLILSVSKDSNKEQALINLLKSSIFIRKTEILLDKVIIYCSRREQTEKLASILRMSFSHLHNNDSVAKKFQFNSKIQIAEAYHAGLNTSQRKRVQTAFLNGKLRIIIATLAFGMGINMKNIRAVIHYNMPKSIENYVQEIGRAGRRNDDDGEADDVSRVPAVSTVYVNEGYERMSDEMECEEVATTSSSSEIQLYQAQPEISLCHLFLDTQQNDINEIRKYLYGDNYDQLTIKKFLNKVFVPVDCNCSDSTDTAVTHQIALAINDLVEYIDVKEESILTLLCYLQNLNYIQLMPNCYKYCTIKAYKGVSYLKQLATNNDLLKRILSSEALREDSENNSIRFDLVSLCFKENWDLNMVKTKLRALEWEFKDTKSANSGGGYVKSGNKVEFYDLSFHVKHKCMKNNFDEMLDEIFDAIWQRVNEQQKLAQLNFKGLYKILTQSAFNTVDSLINDYEFNKRQLLHKQNDGIKALIDAYFIDTEFNLANFCADFKFEHELNVNNFLHDKQKEALVKSIRKFINLYNTEIKLNGRLIAKIFHGIASPKCPSEIWARNRQFWRSHLDFDFEYIIQAATLELINY